MEIEGGSPTPDEAAGERTYSEFFPRLVAVARCYGLPLDDALEVAQDAFVEFWVKRPKAINTEAWLVRLVGRRAIDRLRRARLRPAVEARGAKLATRSSRPEAETRKQRRVRKRAAPSRDCPRGFGHSCASGT